MNVFLTEKLEELVENGRYRSASEVVREGLRLLEIREAQLQPKPHKGKGSKDSK